MATSVYLLALVAVCCVPSISACRDLQYAFIEMRNFYRDVAIPRNYDKYKEEALSWLGLDLDNDEQILSLACGLADAESLDNVVTLMGISPENAWSERHIIRGFLFTQQIEVIFWPEIRKEYDTAFQFLADTSFLEFPLDLSKEEALALTDEAGRLGLEKIFGPNVPFPSSFGWFVDALTKSKTIEQFNYFTYGKFEDLVNDFDGKLKEMRARYHAVKLKSKVQARFLATLDKYGIPDEWSDY